MAARGSVLLYNFTDKARTDKVKFIFVLMGIKIRSVAKEDYLQPIGALSGVTRIERTEEVYEGEGFEEEMLVICNLTDAQMNQMLAYFRKEGIQIALKAALTPTNMNWSSVELHDELVREHEAVQKQIREQREQKGQNEQKSEQ
ncbi:DUF3783 domain-containing protein [Faecalicatena contorta]|uniref:DUF3783 domain-containing protein n=1 Tax=Faecalicatena fissicatena TaxID=290055 RepID=A0ABS2E671_9FIRM|nr:MULTISPECIES: DUF3783 domain-containing protein [Clostridia]MBM6685894.1 DUF3783 domain-containing protein [Faecalicatena contorta]MBM6711460.1 DUF3783 domain-containing protein [Faecalicatena contorta]MBM6737125.1 DUF3783 domain-containing protein [Faecalicatena fissicatena]HIX99090.1 DUF3783 domain-containing protein [Candidatus Dorea intestinigallinarum]